MKSYVLDHQLFMVFYLLQLNPHEKYREIKHRDEFFAVQYAG